MRWKLHLLVKKWQKFWKFTGQKVTIVEETPWYEVLSLLTSSLSENTLHSKATSLILADLCEWGPAQDVYFLSLMNIDCEKLEK